MGNNQTPVTMYLNNNSFRLTKKDIIDIFAYINDVSTVSASTPEGSRHPVFNIMDTDLQKRQQIKQIRATNKAKDLTKEEVAGKVWKYCYIPPSLESFYFERNVGDNKELTKIRQLVPTEPFKRKEPTESAPQNWVIPGLTSEYLA
jgi:hypothetical protein